MFVFTGLYFRYLNKPLIPNNFICRFFLLNGCSPWLYNVLASLFFLLISFSIIFPILKKQNGTMRLTDFKNETATVRNPF